MVIPADRSTSPVDDEGTGRPRYSTVKTRIRAFHLRSVGISSTLASSCTHRHRGIEQDRETGYVIEFGWRMGLTPRVCQTRGNGLAIRCRIDTPLSKNYRIRPSEVWSAFNPSYMLVSHVNGITNRPGSTYRPMIIIDRSCPTEPLKPLALPLALVRKPFPAQLFQPIFNIS